MLSVVDSTWHIKQCAVPPLRDDVVSRRNRIIEGMGSKVMRHRVDTPRRLEHDRQPESCCNVESAVEIAPKQPGNQCRESDGGPDCKPPIMALLPNDKGIALDIVHRDRFRDIDIVQ